MFARNFRNPNQNSRNSRRARQALIRANRSNHRWMSHFRSREQRLAKWQRIFKPFVPLTLSRFKYFWAAMTSILAGLIHTATMPTSSSSSRVLSRAGMIRWGGGKKDRRGRKKTRRAESQAQASSANTYETLEDRKLLAVSDLMIGLSGTELTITDTDGINNNLTVQVSGATTTITATGGGAFEPGIPSGLTGGTLSLGNTVLTFDTADVSSVVVDAAGGDDILRAINVDSSDFDLTFTGGVGTDNYFLNSSTLAALDPGGSNLLAGEILYASGSGNRVDSDFLGAAGSNIVVDGSVTTAPGDLTIGDAGSSSGFATLGTILVSDNYELTLLDSNQASLGSLTTVADGGTLTAVEGINLSGSDVLTGAGTVGVGTGTDDLNLDSGTVQGALTINGDVDVEDGTLTGNGVVNGDVDLGTGLVAGNITVNGALSGPSVSDNAVTISPVSYTHLTLPTKA